MAKLKVYQGSVDGRNSYCVAATSWKAAHAAMDGICKNVSLHYMMTMWGVTGNDKQIAAAMSEPGTVFGAEGYVVDAQYVPLRSSEELIAFQRQFRIRQP